MTKRAYRKLSSISKFMNFGKYLENLTLLAINCSNRDRLYKSSKRNLLQF